MVEPNKLHDQVIPSPFGGDVPGERPSAADPLSDWPDVPSDAALFRRPRSHQVRTAAIVGVGLAVSLFGLGALDRELTSPSLYLGGWLLGAFVSGMLAGLTDRGPSVYSSAFLGFAVALSILAGILAFAGNSSTAEGNAIGATAILGLAAAIPLFVGCWVGRFIAGAL